MERHHLGAQTQALLRGTSRVEIAPDLEFVLRYTPNHHRALSLFVRLAAREKTDKPAQAQDTVRCHFERALAFRPDDHIARVMFADYLLSVGQEAEGLAQIDKARLEQADSGITQYNIGLVYAERGKYELALEQAHKALALGVTRQELRRQLEAAGRWREPEPKSQP